MPAELDDGAAAELDEEVAAELDEELAGADGDGAAGGLCTAHPAITPTASKGQHPLHGPLLTAQITAVIPARVCTQHRLWQVHTRWSSGSMRSAGEVRLTARLPRSGR
jgi:hypothetical protein